MEGEGELSKDQPHLVVIAGPNGAGKSTSAPSLLQGALGVSEFVNADTIAGGLSAFRPEAAALQAGRVMLGRLQHLAEQRADFAFETTLATRSFAPWIAALRRKGYTFNLVFLWLSSPQLALARVAERVRLGGHDVPAEVVERRYHAGLRNFFGLYRVLADKWMLWDNSDPTSRRVLASGEGERMTSVEDGARWRQIQETYHAT